MTKFDVNDSFSVFVQLNAQAFKIQRNYLVLKKIQMHPPVTYTHVDACSRV